MKSFSMRTGSPAARAPSTYSSGQKWSGVGADSRASSPCDAKVDHRLRPVLAHGIADVVVETPRPRVGRGIGRRPVHPRQVVDHVAGADDQNAFLAQRRQALADGVALGRVDAGVHAQLHHRHRGLGIGVHQYRPGAVVQAPLALVGEHLARRQQVSDPRGQRRAARRRIAHVEQGLREGAEVVDGARRLGRGHGGAAGEPVRRHAQDRLRPRQRAAQLAPDPGQRAVLERVHRAAVAEEHHRHARRLAHAATAARACFMRSQQAR